MRWMRLLVAASGLAGWQYAAAQARDGSVRGQLTMLEKGSKPARDLGAAVVYLEGPGPAAPPLTVDIAINDKEFTPRVVVVPVGSSVRFPNYDPFDHNAFSASDPNGFDLGQYGRGEARARVFEHAGLVRVFCNIHPRMVAFILVVTSRHYTQPAADGSFTIPTVAPGTYTLHVWHERSPEVTRGLTVSAAGLSGVDVQLDARGFRWAAHKNKYGRDYPTDAGFDRY
ncbi:MAG TPA: carboxypeptidase regulatory-like domain-containing protein [Gemmatimonadales bacterium]|nr:carboxypeptidase regulatory-like domain-containing protein [Gemmatimonadales bacterium]